MGRPPCVSTNSTSGAAYAIDTAAEACSGVDTTTGADNPKPLGARHVTVLTNGSAVERCTATPVHGEPRTETLGNREEPSQAASQHSSTTGLDVITVNITTQTNKKNSSRVRGNSQETLLT